MPVEHAIAVENFGLAVRYYREQQGMNQTQLADAAGMDQGKISKIEAGKVDIRISTAAAIADALEVELHQLLAYQPEKKRALAG